MAARKHPNPALKGKGTATVEQAEQIIALIEQEAKSYREACDIVGVNTSRTWELINRDLSLRERYAQAREQRGITHGERIASLAQDVLNGQYPPDVARVAIDALKWVAARMAPKQYGDKVTTEITGREGGPLQIEHSVARENLISAIQKIK